MPTDLTWADVQYAAARLAKRAKHTTNAVAGIPRGGVPVACLVAAQLDVPIVDVPDQRAPGTLVVDDLADTGATASRLPPGQRFDALYRKSHTPADLAPHAEPADDWLVFPWERGTPDAAGPTDAVTRLLEFIGEDPTRDGLIETPRRVVRSLTELTAGYRSDPATILDCTFDVAYDEMVVVRDVPFVSLCEHHLLPFTGTATLGYIPTSRVVGLSKLARLVDCYAQRLQVQERLTRQIAEAIDTNLEPAGVGVVVRAEHSCMSARGVRKAAPMITSTMLGALRDKPPARAEFLALARTQ